MTRILRIREVVRVTGISRTSIYRKIRAKEFPGSVKTGTQTVGWRERDVEAWMESLPPTEVPGSQTNGCTTPA